MEISEDELVPSDTRDIGIQCCLENRFMVTTTISTQTNKADIYVDTADACIQEDENSTLEKLNILHDHTYATAPVSPVVSPQKSLKSISKIEEYLKNRVVCTPGLMTKKGSSFRMMKMMMTA